MFFASIMFGYVRVWIVLQNRLERLCVRLGGRLTAPPEWQDSQGENITRVPPRGWDYTLGDSPQSGTVPS